MCFFLFFLFFLCTSRGVISSGSQRSRASAHKRRNEAGTTTRVGQAPPGVGTAAEGDAAASTARVAIACQKAKKKCFVSVPS